MMKRFLSLLLAFVFCAGLLPAASAETETETAAVQVRAGEIRKDPGALNDGKGKRVYRAGTAEKDSQASEGVTFRPYVFEIDENSQVKASVELEPGLTEYAAREDSDVSGDPVENGTTIDPVITPISGGNTSVVINTTIEITPPKILSASVSGEAFELYYISGHPDVTMIETYVYTVNASLAMNSGTEIFNGTVVYERAITTSDADSDRVTSLQLGGKTYITVNDFLYTGDKPAPQPGEKLYIVVEEFGSDYQSGGTSEPALVTVPGGEELTREELKERMPENLEVQKLNSNMTVYKAEVSWTGYEDVDAYNMETFLEVNDTKVFLKSENPLNNIQPAGPGVPASQAYQVDNNNCVYKPLVLHVLQPGDEQFMYNSAGDPDVAFAVKNGDILVVTLAGKILRTGQETPAEVTTIRIVVETAPVTLDQNATMISLTPGNFTYTGQPNEPEIEVTHDGVTLVQDTDYSVAIENNIDAGEGLVTVTGQGGYTGNITESFPIVPAELNAENTVVVLENNTMTSTGEELRPAVVSVAWNGVTLTADDYTVGYKDNVNPGKGQALVTGKGNFSGTVAAEFDILPGSGTVITLDQNATVINLTPGNFTYTGQPNEPEVEVVHDGVALVQDTDYSVAIENNVNAGEGLVTVTGQGGYTGNITESFPIAPAELNAENTVVVLENNTMTSTGEELRPAVISVTWNGVTLTADDYTVDYKDNVNPGKGQVLVTGKGNFGGTVLVPFDILNESGEVVVVTLDQNATVINLTPGNFTYTGQPNEPEVGVTHNGIVLEQGTDYSVAIENNVNAGEGLVTVTGQGGYAGNITGSFPIAPAELNAENTVVVLENNTMTSTGEELRPAVVSVTWNGVALTADDYTVDYKDNVNPGKGQALVTGKGNFSGTVAAEFDILPEPGTVITLDENSTVIRLTPENATFTGQPNEPAVEVLYNNAPLKPGTDYTVAYKDNVNAGEASVIITFQGAYGGTAIRKFVIEKGKNKTVKVTKTKKIKLKKLKKKNQTFKITAKLLDPGKKTFKLISVPKKAKKYIKVSKKGKVTVKKGLQKGTYKIRVRITVQETDNCLKTIFKKKIKIIVK